MLTLFRPRLRSWEDSVAVQTLSSFAFSSGDRTGAGASGDRACPAAGRPAASAGAVRLLPLQIIGLGPGAEVRERRRAFLNPRDQPAGGESGAVRRR